MNKKLLRIMMGFLFLMLSNVVYAQEKTPEIPQRIASVNICIDQLLWELVAREHLVSISHLTANPVWSSIAKQVQGTPLNHGLAEEIVPAKPDIIFAGEFDAPDVIDLLKKLGLRVERLPVPRTLDDINLQILQLGGVVGAQEKANQMVREIAVQIAGLQTAPRGEKPQTAFWYSSNGVVIGADTLEHELMQIAGLRNLAAERGLFGFNQFDLELLLQAKPDILIIEESNDDAFSLAREYLTHPALKHADFKTIVLPEGLSGCAATVIGDVSVALKQGLVSAAEMAQ